MKMDSFEYLYIKIYEHIALLLFWGLAQTVREAAVVKTDRQKITMAGWWAYMTRKERQSGDRKRGWAVCEQKGEGE